MDMRPLSPRVVSAPLTPFLALGAARVPLLLVERGECGAALAVVVLAECRPEPVPEIAGKAADVEVLELGRGLTEPQLGLLRQHDSCCRSHGRDGGGKRQLPKRARIAVAACVRHPRPSFRLPRFVA